MNRVFIRRFEIAGLFGYKNLQLSFDGPAKIIIGENGYGKTTILKALSFLLKSDYKNLYKIKFDTISIEFDEDHRYSFLHNDIKAYIQYQENQSEDKDSLFKYIKNQISHSELTELLKSINKETDFYKIIQRYDSLKHIPSKYIYQVFFELVEMTEKFKAFKEMETYINSTGYKILYYPTYRRIEADLKNIISNTEYITRRRLDIDINSIIQDNSIMKFGMGDVEKRKDKICEEISRSSISGFAAVSGGMISKFLDRKLEGCDEHKFDYNEMSIVLSRIGENMSKEDKTKILNQLKDDPFLSEQSFFLKYFLNQLLSVYKKQEKYDTAIKQFVRICNKYLTDKEFIYDESLVSLNLYRKNTDKNDELKLTQLSSGEKQIISIFSQLYLEPDKKYIILFDEPELSLSIYWQEKLLPDMLESGRCVFLLAVTHSPFIFNNNLKYSTIGIQEFAYE